MLRLSLTFLHLSWSLPAYLFILLRTVTLIILVLSDSYLILSLHPSIPPYPPSLLLLRLVDRLHPSSYWVG